MSLKLKLKGGQRGQKVFFTKAFLGAVLLFFCFLNPKVVLANESMDMSKGMDQPQSTNQIQATETQETTDPNIPKSTSPSQNQIQTPKTPTSDDSQPLSLEITPTNPEPPTSQDSPQNESPTDSDNTGQAPDSNQEASPLPNEYDAQPESPQTPLKEDTADNNQKQSTDYSCGPAALVTWIKFLGGEAKEKELMELAQTNSEEGTTFLNLKKAAIAKGFTNTNVYKITLDELAKIKLPALIYLNVEGSEIGHYAVLTEINGDELTIQDPAKGTIKKSKEEFAIEFGGYAMINGSFKETAHSAEAQPETDPATNSDNATAIPKIKQIELTAKPVQEKTIENIVGNAPAVTNESSTNLVNNNIQKVSDEELSQIKGKGVPLVVATAAMARFIGVPITFVKKHCKRGMLAKGHTMAYVSCFGDALRVHIDRGGTGHVAYRHITYYWYHKEIYKHRI